MFRVTRSTALHVESGENAPTEPKKREKSEKTKKCSGCAEVRTKKVHNAKKKSPVEAKTKVKKQKITKVKPPSDELSEAEKYKKMRKINNKSSARHRQKVKDMELGFKHTLILLEKDKEIKQREFERLNQEKSFYSQWYATHFGRPYPF